MKKHFAFFALSIFLVVSQLIAQTSFEKYIGGPYDGDVGIRVIPASDGGYIITGSWTIDYGPSWDTETDAVLVKIDNSGNLVWKKMIPTVVRYTGSDQLRGITQTQDGGYLAVGVIQTANEVGKEDLLIAKFTSSGDTLWTKRYDFAAYDCGNAVVPSGDGGYIIAGRCGPLGNDNILFLKINESGDTLWTRTWGGAYADRLNDIVPTPDGNFYAVGCFQNPSTYVLSDYIIKLSTKGDTIWTKRITGTETMSIHSTSDGGYIIAEEKALVKVDSIGTQQWRKANGSFMGIYGGKTHSAVPITGGGYVLAGRCDYLDPADQQLFMARFSSTGDTVWTRRFGRLEFNKPDDANWVIETSDGGFLAVGWTYLNQTSARDIYVVKVNGNGITSVNNSKILIPEACTLEQNYPNPFNPSTTINYQLSVTSNVKLSVFDLLGRKITTLVNELQTAGAHHITFDAHALSSGMYFYKLTAGNFTEVKKMMLMK